MTNEQYYDMKLPYQDALNLLLARLEVLNHTMYDDGTERPIHNIQSRIKSKKSIEEKLERMEYTPSVSSAKDHLQDIAGVRVICYFVRDVDDLVETLKNQKDLILIKEKDYIRRPKPNGYRSYHMVVGVPVCYMNSMEYYPVEIQLRTLGMDFWASMEHRVCYKKERENKEQIQRELLAYGEILQKMEQSFEKYHGTRE